MASRSSHHRRAMPAGSRRWRFAEAGDGAPFVAASLYVLVLMLFGGGEQVFSAANLMICAVSLAVALFATARGGLHALAALPWPARAGILGIALVPLIQMIPLPPGIWQSLPGQALRETTLGLAGHANRWQPISLTPLFTAATALVAIGFVGFCALLLMLSPRARGAIGFAIFGLVLAGILIGVLQVGSEGSVARLHRHADHGALLGFFANKNHMALMLAASLPLLHGLLRTIAIPVERLRVAIGGYWLLMMVAILTTNSRAGLILGLLASVAVVIGLLKRDRLKSAIPLIGAAALAGIALAASPAFDAVWNRFGRVQEDGRWDFLVRSWPLVGDYLPMGSGAGSFRQVYANAEQLAWVGPYYVNAVHNDYLQNIIEFGVLGALAMLLLAAAIIVAGRQVLFQRGVRSPASHLAGAGLVVILLFAAHSIVDYPLRRPATHPLFGFALVTLLAMPRDPEPATRRSRA